MNEGATERDPIDWRRARTRPLQRWLQALGSRCGTAFLVVACSACTSLPEGAAAGTASELRVMSYNIRVGTADDGVNAWDLRKDWLAATVRAFAPDLLGTQETLDFQRDFLAGALPEYDHIGLARDAQHDDGEMMALFYRRDRFEKLDEGHFWLSETPTIPGSRSWASACPRMVTWIRLRDRQRPGARPLVYLNTHFDHESAAARENSARLVRARIEALAGDSTIILTGDFNTDAGSPPYVELFGPHDGTASPLLDTYRVAHPERGPNERTFSEFVAGERPGARIDWIGATRDWHVRAATIDHTARDGRTPSDHFAVTAVLDRD